MNTLDQPSNIEKVTAKLPKDTLPTIQKRLHQLQKKPLTRQALQAEQERLEEIFTQEINHITQTFAQSPSPETRALIYQKIVQDPLSHLIHNAHEYEDLIAKERSILYPEETKLRQQFIQTQIKPLIEDISIDNVHTFVTRLLKIKANYPGKQDNYTFTIRDLNASEKQQILEAIESKINHLNTKCYSQCTPQQHQSLETGDLRIIDGQLVPSFDPIIFAGTHGDELKPVQELTELASQLNARLLPLIIDSQRTHIETAVNPYAIQNQQRAFPSGIDINRPILDQDSKEFKHKQSILAAIPEHLQHPFTIDLHNCHNHYGPYGFSTQLSPLSVHIAKEAGLTMLIIPDESLTEGSMMSESVKRTNGIGLTIETNINDQTQISSRIAFKLLHASGTVKTDRASSQPVLELTTEIKMPTRNDDLAIYKMRYLPIEPHNIPDDNHFYQIINGKVIKISKTNEDGTTDEPLSPNEIKMFNELN